MENLSCCTCDVKIWLVWMVVVVVHRSLRSFFFLLRVVIDSVLYDFALCRILYVCVDVRCVHPNHEVIGYVLIVFVSLDTSF